MLPPSVLAQTGNGKINLELVTEANISAPPQINKIWEVGPRGSESSLLQVVSVLAEVSEMLP